MADVYVPDYEQQAAAFAEKFARPPVIEWRDVPFALSAGGESHWYVDTRRGVGFGPDAEAASLLMLERAERSGIVYDAIGGLALGATPFVTCMRLLHKRNITGVEINKNTDPGQRYGYGVHGADVTGIRVLVVDDVATSAASLATSTEMLRRAGGIVEDALVLTDRGKDVAAAVLRAMEPPVQLHSVFTFDETTGQLSLTA